jgi:alpha-L-fucosidase
MSSFSLPAGARLTMLGSTSRLSWKNTGSGFVINIPEKLRVAPPAKYVWVIKASY